MHAADREYERRDRAALEAALRDAGADLRGTAVKCPFHDDASPSGSVYSEDGVWRFRCHAPGCGFGGDVFDVRAKAAGRPLGDVLPRDAARRDWPPRSETVRRGRVFDSVDALARSEAHVAAVYRYTAPGAAEPELVVLRLEPPGRKKEFRQCRPALAGGWEKRKPEGRMPIYNRTRVRTAGAVIVAEGEKCVHALTPVLRPGWAATTAPGGCTKGRAEEADWSPLAGKAVYLWPDNDEGGIDHMRRIAALLQRLPDPPRVHWLDPAGLGLPPKGDAADLLAAAGAADPSDVLDDALGKAELLSAVRELEGLVEDTIAGRRAAVPWPWPELHRLTRALLPGTLTVLCGGVGGSKSFFALACCWEWLHAGHKAAYLALEMTAAEHQLRLLAYLDGRWEYLDDEWVRANPAEVRDALRRRRDDVAAFAPHLSAPHTEIFSRKAALDWMKARCADGCRVLFIDPVTALDDDGDVWTQDKRFVMAARSIVTPAGASVVFVTHPRTGAATKGLAPIDAVAGGAAYRNFTDSVLWLQKPRGTPQSKVRRAGAAIPTRHNRILHLLKTRFGSGGGRDLAFNFGDRGPSFSEIGVIVGDDED